MKYIEVAQVGRGAPSPLRYPVLPGRDVDVLIAQELAWYKGHGAVIQPVYGAENAYAVWCDPQAIIGTGAVLRISVVEYDPANVADEDTQELLPAIPFDAELQEMYTQEARRQAGTFGG